MKIRRSVLLTFEVDPESWAAEYGIPVKQAASDFDTALASAATELPKAITAQWRALNGTTALTASTPITSEDDMPAAIEAAGYQTHHLAGAIDRYHEDEQAREVLKLVRGMVAAEQAKAEPGEQGNPRYVIIRASDWDNGWFLYEGDMTLIYDDGTEVDLDAGSDGSYLHDALTDGWGRVDSETVLGVDLRTGSVDSDDDERSLRASWEIPDEPGQPTLARNNHAALVRVR